MNHDIIKMTIRALDARTAAIAFAEERGIAWRSISTDFIAGRTIIRDQAYDVVAIIEAR